MFEERNLLYFNEYYFENGNPAKPKYFLVLKSDKNGMMLISLPSSKDYIPANIEKKHGCINIPEKQIGCYFFQNNIPITGRAAGSNLTGNAVGEGIILDFS